VTAHHRQPDVIGAGDPAVYDATLARTYANRRPLDVQGVNSSLPIMTPHGPQLQWAIPLFGGIPAQG